MKAMEKRLRKIRARLEGLTPGEWSHMLSGFDEVQNAGFWTLFTRSPDPNNEVLGFSTRTVGLVNNGNKADAIFLANAKSDIEYLLAAITVLK